MDLKTYWNSLDSEQRFNLLTDAELSYSTMYQITSGRRKVGVETAAKLMSADSKITWRMVRPDIDWPPHIA
jgi:DNA-binding transcriptional regulator YdaS (Cro superfamily)